MFQSKGQKMKAVVNLDTCGKFYDFLVENGIEFIVDGMGEIPEKDLDKILQKQTSKVILKLVFKGKLKELLAIMTDTQEDFGKAGLKEVKEIVQDFFQNMQELSNGSLMCLLGIQEQKEPTE